MIATVKKTEGVGSGVLKKTIHKGSESIVFDVLQVTQYKYPIKSSIREIVTNCLDSVNERDDSLAILRGDLSIADRYVEKEGEEFTESSFNPKYYHKEWLSDEKKVVIEYIEYDTELRDKIRFIDHGVGLGGSRLVNFFALGFSTKRKSISQSGSFGLGAKALLATDIDYYTMVTRYNGKKYTFNIFKDHSVPTTPKFRENGEANIEEHLNEDLVVYYEPTTEKNGVIIEAEVKRHKKQEYINAIKNQLGFIENIELKMVDKLYDMNTTKNIKTNIVFKKDNTFVGDFDYYSVPQIVLKPGPDSNIMISYGKLSFPDLEMKNYTGNVVFVMDINTVDVTPSRESLRYTNKTRDAVKGMFEEAQKTIFDTIEQKLVGIDNLPEYLYKFNEHKNPHANGGMSELFKVIDTAELTSKFKGFKLSKHVRDIETEFGNKLIFTATNVKSNRDSEYKIDYSFNKIGEKYLSRLTPSNSLFYNTVLYIGEVRSKNLALYMSKKMYNNNEDVVHIIFMHQDLFESIEKYENDIQGAVDEIYAEDLFDKKLSLFKDYAIAYESLSKEDKEARNKERSEQRAAVRRRSENAQKLIYLSILLAKQNGMRTVFSDDIDQNPLNTVESAKKSEEDNRYLSYSAKERAKGKWGIRKFVHSNYSSTIYKYEEEFRKELLNGAVIYELSDDVVPLFLNRVNFGYNDSFTVLGLNKEQYKMACGMPGAKPFIGALYTIEFGDFKFTPFGEAALTTPVKTAIKAILGGEKPTYEHDVHNYLKHVIKNAANFGMHKQNHDRNVNNDIRDMGYAKERKERAMQNVNSTLYEYSQKTIINNK